MNLLTLAGPWLLQLIPGRGTVYLLLGALAAGFGGGVYVTMKFWQASEVAAVNEARAKERTAALLGDEHERGALDRARERKEHADAAIEELRLRLAHGTYCRVPVPPAWLRPGPRVPRAPADPSGARPAHPAMDPTPEGGRRKAEGGSAEHPFADAGAVVLTCERNRLEAYQPEADDRAALRAWYEALRRSLNR